MDVGAPTDQIPYGRFMRFAEKRLNRQIDQRPEHKRRQDALHPFGEQLERRADILIVSPMSKAGQQNKQRHGKTRQHIAQRRDRPGPAGRYVNHHDPGSSCCTQPVHLRIAFSHRSAPFSFLTIYLPVPGTAPRSPRYTPFGRTGCRPAAGRTSRSLPSRRPA